MTEKFEKWFHESQIENSLFPNVMKLFDTSKDILQEAYQAGANASGCAKLLVEQDYKYNKQTNEIIARHAEQLEVAAEFCRQYQIEIAQLKSYEFMKNCADELLSENNSLGRDNEVLKAEKAHLQFLLDSVMIEYCPDEMTEEQMENWSKHQKKVDITTSVDTSNPEYYKSDTYKNNIKYSVDMIK